MTIRELLQRIRALIEEYLESNVVEIGYLKEENSSLKEENSKLKDKLQDARDLNDMFDDACNDACDTLKHVMEGRI